MYLWKNGMRMWAGHNWLRIGSLEGFCTPSGSLRAGNFFTNWMTIIFQGRPQSWVVKFLVKFLLSYLVLCPGFVWYGPTLFYIKRQSLCALNVPQNQWATEDRKERLCALCVSQRPSLSNSSYLQCADGPEIPQQWMEPDISRTLSGRSSATRPACPIQGCQHFFPIWEQYLVDSCDSLFLNLFHGATRKHNIHYQAYQSKVVNRIRKLELLSGSQSCCYFVTEFHLFYKL
jgi:hypothetical protein